jgi:hypothetical protein
MGRWRRAVGNGFAAAIGLLAVAAWLQAILASFTGVVLMVGRAMAPCARCIHSRRTSAAAWSPQSCRVGAAQQQPGNRSSTNVAIGTSLIRRSRRRLPCAPRTKCVMLARWLAVMVAAHRRVAGNCVHASS